MSMILGFLRQRRNSVFLLLAVVLFLCAGQADADRTVRAMWVWHTLDPMTKADKRKELLDFCKERGISELFFQMQYAFAGGDGGVMCSLSHQDHLRSFLRDAHKRGIKVHALDGDPTFVLKSNHPKVLAQVKAILEFNAKGKPDEGYDGIHLDNEPYLLVGYNGSRRKQILQEFVELNKKCMDAVRSSGQKIVFGIDIPFWFEEVGDSGEVSAELDFNGSKKAVSYHLLDIVDNVGIMDYRNFADGSDGIIAHGMDEVEYATKIGKKVYIGVETYRPDPEKVVFIYGHPKYEFENRLDSVGGKFAKQYTYKNLKIRKLDDGANMHIGVLVPKEPERRAVMEGVIEEICRVFGKDVYLQDESAINDMMFNAEFAVSKEGPYENFSVNTIPSDRANRAFVRFEADLVTLPKITFGGMSKREMEEELAAAEEAFKGHAGFYGFAIHFYESYKSMKE